MKIAFGYKMSTGKDTCVDYLIEKYGGKKYSFSKYLYDILYYAQSICKFNQEKDRKFLQWIGTEWGRNIDKDIWVKLFLEDIKNDEKNGVKNFFCSDVRFLNEFEALKKNGWICVKLVRRIENDERIGSGNETHISEYELDSLPDDKWDFTIENNGSLEDLKKKLDNII
jgi:dephospho-CoA kinase